jgi:hypothetical protein
VPPGRRVDARRAGVPRRVSPGLGLERRELVGEPAFTPEAIDRPVARRRRDPRARVGGCPVARPSFERDGERLLDGLFGQVDVADGAGDGRDGPPGLAPEDSVDDVGGAFR